MDVVAKTAEPLPRNCSARQCESVFVLDRQSRRCSHPNPTADDILPIDPPTQPNAAGFVFSGLGCRLRRYGRESKTYNQTIGKSLIKIKFT